jgi:hypothetical protein
MPVRKSVRKKTNKGQKNKGRTNKSKTNRGKTNVNCKWCMRGGCNHCVLPH